MIKLENKSIHESKNHWKRFHKQAHIKHTVVSIEIRTWNAKTWIVSKLDVHIYNELFTQLQRLPN